MKKKNLLPLLAVAALLTACDEEQYDAPQLQKGATFTVPDFVDEAGTRVAVSIDNDGAHFVWTEGDTLGVFPANGYQTAFPISNGQGTNIAIFDGADWALRPRASYAAYYPMQHPMDAIDKTAIEVSYLGQTQDGNGSTSHIGKFDYLASIFTGVDGNGNASFDMKHLGCLVRFQLTMPEADSYTSMTLSCEGSMLTTAGKFDLTAATPALTVKSQDASISLALNNIATTEANQVLTLYMMLPPMDLGGKNLSIKVSGEKNYETTIDGKNMKAGSIYGYSQSANESLSLLSKELKSLLKQLPSSSNQPIKKIVFETSVNGSSGILVSDTYSPVPAYAQYDESLQTITIRTKAKEFHATRLDFSNFRELEYIENLSLVNTNGMKHLSFDNCICLKKLDTRNFDTSSIESFNNVFFGCRSLESLDVSNFDTRNASNFVGCFRGCKKLKTIDVSNFNTENCTSLCQMFAFCDSLETLDLSSFNTNNVCNFSAMFESCSELESLDLSNFNTVNAVDMESMFYGCRKLKELNVSSFNTSNVEYMSYMFENCNSLTSIDVSSFDVSNVAEMPCMFAHCESITSLDLSNFNTVNAVNMAAMFHGCKNLESLDLGTFDTHNVETMNGMFALCYALKSLNISSFNTSNVEDMTAMFSSCRSLKTLDITNFDTRKVSKMTGDRIEFYSHNSKGYCIEGGIKYGMFSDCELNNLKLGSRFSLDKIEDKSNICSGLASYPNCTITCMSAVQEQLSNGTGLQNDRVTWVIIDQAVDLGLPSGTMWATCNVGATQPEEYGDYFAWGETEPYYTEGHSQDNPCENWKSGKSGYNWANYKWCNGSQTSMTKYCTSSSYGTVDDKTVLEASDDAAAANWGGSWRMSTTEEHQELLNNCTWNWTTKNGVNGYEVVGPNGNSIFLPAAGLRRSSAPYNAGSHGYYWSSSLGTSDSYQAYDLSFYSSTHWDKHLYRYCGLSIRPVCSISVDSNDDNHYSSIPTGGFSDEFNASRRRAIK